MQESPPKFPNNVPSPSTANTQEDERVPHIQDFLVVPATLSPATEPNKGLAGMGQSDDTGPVVDLPPHGMCK